MIHPLFSLRHGAGRFAAAAVLVDALQVLQVVIQLR
jgi:hypothetical protein